MADALEFPEDDLPSTAYAVLGLLSFGRELTGYDLRKWGENLRFFYWSPAQSAVYTELRRLLGRGYVSEREVPQQPGRRPKRYYRITEAGEHAFRNWLRYSHVDPPVIKHSVMLRLFFGHRGDADRLRAVLSDYQDWLKKQRGELDTLRADLLPDFPYPRLVALWGDSFYAAEAKAVRTVLAELEKWTDEGATPAT